MVEVGRVVSDHRGSYRMQTMRWDHRGVSDVVQATWWVLTYSSMWCELRGVSYVAGLTCSSMLCELRGDSYVRKLSGASYVAGASVLTDLA